MSEGFSEINDEEKGNLMSFKLTVSDDGKNNVEMDKGSEEKAEDENLLLELLKKLLELLFDRLEGEKLDSSKLLGEFVGALRDEGINIEISKDSVSKTFNITLKNDEQVEKTKGIISEHIDRLSGQHLDLVDRVSDVTPGSDIQLQYGDGDVAPTSGVQDRNDNLTLGKDSDVTPGSDMQLQYGNDDVTPTPGVQDKNNNPTLYVLVDGNLENVRDACVNKEGCTVICAEDKKEAEKMISVASSLNSFNEVLTGCSEKNTEDALKLRDDFENDLGRSGICIRIGGNNGLRTLNVSIGNNEQRQKIKEIAEEYTDKIKELDSLKPRLNNAEERSEKENLTAPPLPSFNDEMTH